MDRLYKILIIDDDEYSADNLCLELKRYGQLVVEGIARNGSNGKKMIDKLRPDILFLDVELPDMKGIELLEQINSCVTWNMQVIFYTAYDKYMINAIRESAFDYLLKPIDRTGLTHFAIILIINKILIKNILMVSYLYHLRLFSSIILCSASICIIAPS